MGKLFFLFFLFLCIFFSPETKNPLIMQIIDFLQSFPRKLHSIFTSLVDFDGCGLGYLNLGHPLLSRQAVTLRPWPRSCVALRFPACYYSLKMWWLCKNVILNKSVSIYTLKNAIPTDSLCWD